MKKLTSLLTINEIVPTSEILLSGNALSSSFEQSKKALKNILQKCVHLPALEPLLHEAPPNVLKHVVGQYSKVCACVLGYHKNFV